MSTTAGYQQQHKRQQKQKRQQQHDTKYSREVSHSRQATAGTAGVVDNSGKFAAGVVDINGRSSIHQKVKNNDNNIRLLTLCSELEEKKCIYSICELYYQKVSKQNI
jgi:hypothetical protein